MKKKKIIVCGATGFIGRNIAERLAKNDNYEVYGTYFNSQSLDHPGIRMIRADLTDKKDVESAVKGMDLVIQAAATTSGAKDILSRPYYHVTDNALMNSLILRSVYENSIPALVFFSCTVMYQPGDRPVKEADFDANKPLYPSYFGVGWTKVYIEKMCEFYSRLGRTKFLVLRHSNMYGPYDKFDLEKSHVFGATMTKVMTTRDGKIKVWGSGEEERDLLYIDDLVDLVENSVNRQGLPFELYNVGSASSIAVKDLVAKIVACSGKDLKIEHDLAKPSIKTRLCLDISKVKRALGWAPKVSLEEGIKKTMDWHNKFYKKRRIFK